MNREILRLALPNILSNISVPFISSFDTVLMGSLGGEHIAAVGLGSMAFNFVYWNFGFLRMSTTGLTAKAFGANDVDSQVVTLQRAALLALIIAILLVGLQYPFASLTHILLNLRPEQVAMVDAYFYIRILAAPAALGQMVLIGWFFGRQNAAFPLLLTLTVNLANVGFSYYLVKVANYGLAGVAWGTVVAQYLGLGASLGLLWWESRRHSLLLFPFTQHQRSRPETLPRVRKKPSLRAFLSVNRDIFLRTLCLTLSFAFFYNRANALDVGTAVVAANVILLQLVNWLSYGVDGFAFAAESLVGKYAGAGQLKALRRVIQQIFFWGMGLAGLYAAIYAFGGATLLGLFAPETAALETLAAAITYLPIVIVFCLLATPCYLLDGVYVGLTAARSMRQTMLFAFAGYLLFYYLIGQYFANWGLWGSLLFFMVFRAVTQSIWLPRILVADTIRKE